MKREGKIAWSAALVGLGVIFAMGPTLIGKWFDAMDHGGQEVAEPFRIAGNLYYVGASDVTSFLITGPEGHVLIDGGYPGTAPMIMASIARLGFDIKDVRILLNSEAKHDHAGGLAELQQASGAALWSNEFEAAALSSGGKEDSSMTFLPMKLFLAIGIDDYKPPHVDHLFRDGDIIRLGTIAITAHITPGHTRGCTTWTFPVQDGKQVLQVVHRCDLTMQPGISLVEPQKYPGVLTDFEKSFRILRALPVDIFITAHAREFDRWRKFTESARASDPVAPFIDREGYLHSIDVAEAAFRAKLAEQQAKKR